jgi:hypothetical protein
MSFLYLPKSSAKRVSGASYQPEESLFTVVIRNESYPEQPSVTAIAVVSDELVMTQLSSLLKYRLRYSYGDDLRIIRQAFQLQISSAPFTRKISAIAVTEISLSRINGLLYPKDFEVEKSYILKFFESARIVEVGDILSIPIDDPNLEYPKITNFNFYVITKLNRENNAKSSLIYLSVASTNSTRMVVDGSVNILLPHFDAEDLLYSAISNQVISSDHGDISDIGLARRPFISHNSTVFIEFRLKEFSSKCEKSEEEYAQSINSERIKEILLPSEECTIKSSDIFCPLYLEAPHIGDSKVKLARSSIAVCRKGDDSAADVRDSSRTAPATTAVSQHCLALSEDSLGQNVDLFSFLVLLPRFNPDSSLPNPRPLHGPKRSRDVILNALLPLKELRCSDAARKELMKSPILIEAVDSTGNLLLLLFV